MQQGRKRVGDAVVGVDGHEPGVEYGDEEGYREWSAHSQRGERLLVLGRSEEEVGRLH